MRGLVVCESNSLVLVPVLVPALDLLLPSRHFQTRRRRLLSLSGARPCFDAIRNVFQQPLELCGARLCDRRYRAAMTSDPAHSFRCRVLAELYKGTCMSALAVTNPSASRPIPARWVPTRTRALPPARVLCVGAHAVLQQPSCATGVSMASAPLLAPPNGR